jgi:hypothetical protein
LALVLLTAGRYEEALREAEQETHPGFRLWAMAMAQHARGHRAESDDMLRELIEKYSDGGSFQIAEVYGARGEADAAFEWLERAYGQRDGGLAETKASPRLRSLHADPRWPAFLRKVGFGTRRD